MNVFVTFETFFFYFPTFLTFYNVLKSFFSATLYTYRCYSAACTYVVARVDVDFVSEDSSAYSHDVVQPRAVQQLQLVLRH